MLVLLKDGLAQIGPNGPMLFDPAQPVPCCCGANCPQPAPMLDCRDWRRNNTEPEYCSSINSASRAVVTRLRINYTGPETDTNGILSVEMVGESTPMTPNDRDGVGRPRRPAFEGGSAQIRIVTRLGVINAQICVNIEDVGTVFNSSIWMIAPTPILIPLLGGGACSLGSVANSLFFAANVVGQGCDPTESITTTQGFPCGAAGAYTVDAAYRIDGLLAGPCHPGPPPPPPPTGACCVGTICATGTAAGCTSVGGIYKGDGSSCASGLCAQTSPAEGACCLQDGTGRCISTDAQDCTLRLGRFVGGPCRANTCTGVGEPTGSCCIEGGVGGCFEGITLNQCAAIAAGRNAAFDPGHTCADQGCGPPGPGVVGFA